MLQQWTHYHYLLLSSNDTHQKSEKTVTCFTEMFKMNSYQMHSENYQ